MPSILSAMSFNLLQLPRVSSRLVRTNGRTFELWSPNSSQLPFLPGVFRSDFFPEVPRNPSERRYDGHVGVHDCLYVPQYLRQDVGHWPFMRRITQVGSDNYAAAAFAPLVDYWEDAGPNTLAGQLDPAFIDRLSALSRELQARMLALRPLLSATSVTWENRPAFATVASIEMLRRVRYWDEAVDLGVALQRNLWEMEAWVLFVGQRKTWNALNLCALRNTTMEVADEQYIGRWVNGTSEEVVLRYMHSRIPCFVVHEYQSDEMPRTGVRTFQNFLQNTEVEALLSDMNPYQQIARRAGLLDSITVGEDGRGMAPFATAEAERRSSSVYLEGLPRPIPPPMTAPRSLDLRSKSVGRQRAPRTQAYLCDPSRDHPLRGARVDSLLPRSPLHDNLLQGDGGLTLLFPSLRRVRCYPTSLQRLKVPCPPLPRPRTLCPPSFLSFSRTPLALRQRSLRRRILVTITGSRPVLWSVELSSKDG